MKPARPGQLAMRLIRGTRAETPVSAAVGSLLFNLEAVFTLAIATRLNRENLGWPETVKPTP